VILVSFRCTFNGNFDLINRLCSLVFLRLTSIIQWLFLLDFSEKPPLPGCGVVLVLVLLCLGRFYFSNGPRLALQGVRSNTFSFWPPIHLQEGCCVQGQPYVETGID
jgi:hypothetical protein